MRYQHQHQQYALNNTASHYRRASCCPAAAASAASRAAVARDSLMSKLPSTTTAPLSRRNADASLRLEKPNQPDRADSGMLG